MAFNQRKLSQRRTSWFFSRILNNQLVVSLIIILLVLLIILIFTRIAYLFTPVIAFINLIAFPIIAAGILYYLFVPLVNKLVRRGIQRTLAIWIIFLFIVLLISWGISTLIPVLRAQGLSFIDNIPRYNDQLNEIINDLPLDLDEILVNSNIPAYFRNIDWSNVTESLNTILTSTFGGLGSVIGTVAQVVAGLVTMPVVLYYLLLEGYKIPENILQHIPNKYRADFGRLMFKANYQVSQYIRGQILVAVVVGILFAIGYSIIGIDYAISLAVIAAVMNIIPFLGSMIAVIPAFIIALLTSPYMIIKVIIVVTIEQLIEGRIVSPQILGSNLKIHPVTILFILLGAGRLFGLSGVILGVPGYAVVKVIVTEIYRSFREYSDLYDDVDYDETVSEYINDETTDSKE